MATFKKYKLPLVFLEKLLPILLSVMIILGMVPSFFASAKNNCKNHPAHTADCNYIETIEAADCGHQHNDDCKFIASKSAGLCSHTHNEKCGYEEGSEEAFCDKSCAILDEDGIIKHEKDCVYTEAAEAKPCSHTHDEDCGYSEEVKGHECEHMHDRTCGYAEEELGHACEHKCSLCSKDTEDTENTEETTRNAAKTSAPAAKQTIKANAAVGLNLSVPEYKKQIKSLGNDDYRLYLDVTGTYSTPVDLVLVIDYSDSMMNDSSFYDAGDDKNHTRLEAVNKILKGEYAGQTDKDGFIAEFLKSNSNNQISICYFAGDGQEEETPYSVWKNDGWVESDWYSDTASIKTVEGKLLTQSGMDTHGAGTNYEAGLLRAEEMLAKLDAGNGHSKKVIFLSDGAPDYYLSHTQPVKTERLRYGTGTNNAANISDCKQPNIEAAVEFREQHTDVIINTIGVSSDAINDADVLKALAGNNGAFYAANNAAALEDAFDIIGDDRLMQGVSITDTLSDYVDFADSLNMKVTVTDEEDKTSDIDAENYAEPIISKDKKTITLQFNDDFYLKPMCTYTLSFDISVNRNAYEYYDDKGYPHTGDSNTDYHDNDTSSGKAGFFANKKAELVYMFGTDGNEEKKIYDTPVVQIIPANIEPPIIEGNPSYHKQIQSNGGDLYKLFLDIEGKASSTLNPIDVVLVIDNTYSMGTTTLSGASTNYRTAVNNLLMASDGLVSRVLDANEQSRFKVINFANTVTVTASDWTNNQVTINSAINVTLNTTSSNAAAYFANIQDAARKANSALGTTSANKQYVIVISDSVPSVYYNSSESLRYTSRTGGGTTSDSASASTSNSAYNYTTSGCQTATNTAIAALKSAHSDTAIYSIGIAQASNTYLSSFASGGGTFTNVTSNSTLQTALNNITSALLTSESGQQSVEITDGLSKYVDLANDPDFEVTVKSGDIVSDVESSNYTIEISSDRKTVTCKFKESYKLTVGSVYTFSFNVRPTQLAYRQYAESGYSNTGQSDTDADGNNTSVGKAGFYSNTSAKVSYQYGADAEPTVLTYKKPVVQVAKSSKLADEQFLPHTKRIDFLGDDGNNPDTDVVGDEYYRLYLDVATYDQQKGIDLVLVLDKSSSMVNDSSKDMGVAGKTRLEVMNKILQGEYEGETDVDGFIASFLKANPNNRISVVYFGGYQYSGTSWGGNIAYENWKGDGVIQHDFTTKSTTQAEIGAKVRSVENSLLKVSEVPTSGTNYGAGLLYADQLFNKTEIKNDDNYKYMLFLSDGEPTYYITTTSTGSTVPAISALPTSYRRASGGTNSSDAQNSRAPNATLANNFKAVHPNTTISTVSITGVNDYDFTVLNALTTSDGYFASAKVEADMNNALYRMLERQSVSGLTITDTLSKYVDMYSIPDYRVTVTDNSGNVSDIAPSNYTLSYDMETKTVQLEFKSSYRLEPQSVYTISFNVKITDEAYTEYEQSGYNATGDPDSDFEENDTSLNHFGFRTNDRATLRYSIGGDSVIENYDYPVAQVNLIHFLFKKVDSSTSKELEGAEFTLYQCGHTHTAQCGGRDDPSLCDHVHSEYVENSSDNCFVLLRDAVSDEDGMVDFEQLDDGEYMLVESRAPDGYHRPVGQWLITVDRFAGDPEEQLIITAQEKVLPLAFIRNEDGSLSLPNSKKYSLPFLGGSGISIFKIIGFLLIFSAMAIWLIFEIYKKHNIKKYGPRGYIGRNRRTI